MLTLQSDKHNILSVVVCVSEFDALYLSKKYITQQAQKDIEGSDLNILYSPIHTDMFPFRNNIHVITKQRLKVLRCISPYAWGI